MGGGWAWVSLSAQSNDLSPAEIRDALPGSVPSRRNPHLASVRFKGDGPRASLDELLLELADCLRSHHGELLSALGQMDFQLRIGWSPRSPQESLAVSSTLLTALAEIRADVMIDAYDETDENGEPIL
jgi:hypothetical protein